MPDVFIKPTMTPLHPVPQDNYRADIDGLRAIAILAVVTFHAFPSVLPGGFVGVDIFFVISGFLITSIIIKGLNGNSFKFSDFYSRRVRRIFPALIFVLIACYAFAWFSLLPDEYKQLGKHGSAGLGFVSNILYWKESGYFDSSAGVKPFLHLWSLGVEEQFYILFPLILWLSWKMGLNLFTLISSLLIISFCVNILNIDDHPSAVFYILPFRAWELIAGGLLAYISLFGLGRHNNLKSTANLLIAKIIFNSNSYQNKEVLGNVFSILGLVLISFGLIQIDETKVFPGWWAAIPVLGAILLISAGPNAWINKFILSNKIFVWFGLISFPLYLWHWPLLTFPRIILGQEPSLLVRGVSVLASILLAWVTFKFIEKPLRHGGRSKTISLIFISAFVFVFGVQIYRLDGVPNRSANINSMLSQFGWNDDQKDKDCINNIGSEAEFCRLSKNSAPSIFLVGDSMAWQFYFGLQDQTKNNNNETVLAYTQGGCAGFFGFSNRVDYKNCLSVTQKILDLAKNNTGSKTVIFSSFPREYAEDAHPLDLGYSLSVKDKFASKDDFINHVDLTFSGVVTDLLKSGNKIVFIRNNPLLTFDPKKCVERPFKPKGDVVCEERYTNHRKSALEYDEMVDKILKKFPEIKIFDPSDVLCDKNDDACYAIKDGKMMYRDTWHLSRDGSIYVGDSLYKLIKNP